MNGCPECGAEVVLEYHAVDTVETHGLECGPYEHFLDQWYACPECGAKFAIEDLEETK